MFHQALDVKMLVHQLLDAVYFDGLVEAYLTKGVVNNLHRRQCIKVN
jgi:hypothetical protein